MLLACILLLMLVSLILWDKLFPVDPASSALSAHVQENHALKF